ncbi:BrnT family toxin [Gammaproteobacteria bacterium AH-315-E17]|nr:BrnT family toxin [Gammaproteobacteria bacterium AH-315-E17]
MINFEFDEEKSLANLDKHGIDFHQAQSLWDDLDLLEFPTKSDNEPRFLVIGCISTKGWSAIITYRGEKVRLISVRRSRKKEVELYESERFR